MPKEGGIGVSYLGAQEASSTPPQSLPQWAEKIRIPEALREGIRSPSGLKLGIARRGRFILYSSQIQSEGDSIPYKITGRKG
jgi:hypothetical protein